MTDQRKLWKLSPMELKSYNRWFDYSRVRDEMFAATDSEGAPWFAVRSDDKQQTRLNIIFHILESIPYKAVKRDKVELAKRKKLTAIRSLISRVTGYSMQSDNWANVMLLL